jgi:hypothetical protein
LLLNARFRVVGQARGKAFGQTTSAKPFFLYSCAFKLRL